MDLQFSCHVQQTCGESAGFPTISTVRLNRGVGGTSVGAESFAAGKELTLPPHTNTTQSETLGQNFDHISRWYNQLEIIIHCCGYTGNADHRSVSIPHQS